MEHESHAVSNLCERNTFDYTTSNHIRVAISSWGWVVAKQSLRVQVPNHWKTSGDPLLRVLAANGGDLIPAVETVRGQIAVEEGQATGVWLRDTRVTDAGLEALAGLTQVTEFETSEYMTDAGLVHLRGMTALERLMLLKTRLTGDGLKHLRGMTALQHLQLFSGTATDDALSHLPAIPVLTMLSLNSSSGFTDAALEHVARLPQLVSLSLCDAPIRGPGLQYLTRLRALESLDLGGARE